jgi:hypothetical protein
MKWGPTELSYQRYDNLLVGKDLGELDHAAQILFAEAGGSRTAAGDREECNSSLR